MKLWTNFVLIIFLTSCGVHNYDREVNNGLLDFILKEEGISLNKPEVISGIQNIENLNLRYSYKSLDTKTIYLKKLKTLLNLKEIKEIKEKYVLLTIELKDKIDLVKELNRNEIKNYLIQNPTSEFITGLTFLYPQKELNIFKNSSKVTLTIKNGIPKLYILNDKGTDGIAINDLPILDIKSSEICFSSKGYASYEIVDIRKSLGSKCLKPKAIKSKKGIYEGF